MKRLASITLIVAIWMIFVTSLLLVGALLSKSTWRHRFDLGWLLIALIVFMNISRFLDKGKGKLVDYIAISWPAIPGFCLEFLSDLNLHAFELHNASRSLVLFAAFSCALLIFIVMVIALSRFGSSLQHIAAIRMQIYRVTIWFGAIGIAATVIFRTMAIVSTGAMDPTGQLLTLQLWLYKASLITYFLLTLKMTLPLVLRLFPIQPSEAEPVL